MDIQGCFMSAVASITPALAIKELLGYTCYYDRRHPPDIPIGAWLASADNGMNEARSWQNLHCMLVSGKPAA